MTAKIRVLFLCTGNSARSIIAEALLRKLGGNAFEAYSAGTEPKGINPFTNLALAEEDIDFADARSKSMDEFLGDTFHYVITVCDQAAEQCPTFPGKPERIHWSFPDPAAVQGSDDDKLAAFRATVREMTYRVSTFIPVAKKAVSRR